MFPLPRSTCILSCILKCIRQMNAFKPVLSTVNTSFSTTTVNHLKEIRERGCEEDVKVVEGIQVKSVRSDHLLFKADHLHHHADKNCPLCRLKVDIQYTDVLVLGQFLRPDGCILPRWVTGVCARQQRKLEGLVHKAQRAGLLPTFRPDLSNNRERTSLRSNYKWKRYNMHFED